MEYKNKMMFIILIFFLFALSLSSVSAANYTVSGNTFNDIQSVIDSSSSNDTIILDNITYTGSGDFIRVNKSLTIQGESKDKYSTLNARNLSRIFFINNADLVTFKYINFINGNTPNQVGGGIAGGAIRSSNDLYITDCIFRNNVGGSGGAVFIHNTTGSIIINSIFISNVGDLDDEDSYTEGGAIDIHGNNSWIINCSFRGNSAGVSGGAVSLIEGNNNRILNSSFTGNYGESGGAIRLISANTLIENCNFTNNYVTAQGGAIIIRDSIVSVLGSIFKDNLAESNGGAIAFDSNTGNINIESSVFNNNTGRKGGAIYSESTCNILLSNFTNNKVNNTNNAIIYIETTQEIINNTFTDNQATAIIINLGNNVVIEDNNFTNNKGHGILSNNLQNSKVINNNFLNNQDTGFYITGNQNIIQNNNLTNNNIGVILYGNQTGFIDNNIKNSKSDGVRLTGNNILINNNNIANNKGYGLVLNGDKETITNNIFTSNGKSGVYSLKLTNTLIQYNLFDSNKEYGLYGRGANNKVFNNNFTSNNIGIQNTGDNTNFKDNNIRNNLLDGVRLIGNNILITVNNITNNRRHGIYAIGNNIVINKNILTNNSGSGIYFMGNNSQINSNLINGNFKNGIFGKGNKNTISSNRLTKNSLNGKYSTIYFEGNYNNYKSNNISDNNFRGLYSLGNGNKLTNNYLEKNKYAQIVLSGNKNLLTENRAYHGFKSGLFILGSSNTLSKNIIQRNKNGILLRGSSNQLNGNFIQYNSNYGLHVEESKNKIIQNTIRGNRVGILHKKGSSNFYNYNYIVNEKYNLYREKGSINTNYNWWGENKVAKVKNTKITRYAVAKLILPKVNYLKPNKTYKITLILIDNKNKRLNKTIPSTKAQFQFLKRINKKWHNGTIYPNNQTLKYNKAEFKIKTDKKYLIYYLKAKIDNQKLGKIFFPPCDLKVFMVVNPNPTIQGTLVTYTIYIKNIGPGDAYNVNVLTNFPKLKNSAYSFSGSKWSKFNKKIEITKIEKGHTKTIYIRVSLDSKFYGKIKSTLKVNSNTSDIDNSNNKFTNTLKIIKFKPKFSIKSNKTTKIFSNCGPVILQGLLASKGVFINKNTLINLLKPVKGQTSMYMMKKIAAKHGVNLYAVKKGLNSLKKDDIVLLNLSGKTHYVSILSNDKNYVTFNDPDLGPIKISKKEFEKWYTGYALSTENKGKHISENNQKTLKGGNPAFVVGGVAITWGTIYLILSILAIAGVITYAERNVYMNKINNEIDLFAKELYLGYTAYLISDKKAQKNLAIDTYLDTHTEENGGFYRMAERCIEKNGSDRVRCFIAAGFIFTFIAPVGLIFVDYISNKFINLIKELSLNKLPKLPKNPKYPPSKVVNIPNGGFGKGSGGGGGGAF